MKEKMKSRRRVALRSVPQEPTISLSDRRREFLTDLVQRLHDLPDKEFLPQDIQDDIKKYSRSQTSEKAILQLADYPVYAVRQVVQTLLQDLEGNLSLVITNLLRQIHLDDESMKYLSHDDQLKRKLDDYVRKNLSAYLTDANIRTDVSIVQLQKDLAEFFPTEDEEVVGNMFEPLFMSFLPEKTIKSFLASVASKESSLHTSISKFLHEHKFDLIKDALDSGFQPTTPQDWKRVLPEAYMDKFPHAFWKLKTWEQFQPFLELSQQYSLNLEDFIKYSFYKKKEEFLRNIPIRPSKHAPFAIIYNQHEKELLQRTRPWVEDLLCVLIKPKKHCDLYLGKRYGKYYFPTDTFFKDLANPQYICHQGTIVFTMSHPQIDFKSELYVFFLLTNGQIVAQTPSLYEKGVRFMEQGRFQIPKVKDHFLSLPFQAMSPVDQSILRDKFTADVAFFFTTLFEEPLDFDRMAREIVMSMLEKHRKKPLKQVLGFAFQLYFLFSPRYNLSLLSNVVKERMNLFFYNLNQLDELPVDFYYPQYHFLESEKKSTFDRWRTRCMNGFVMESLCFLFSKNYPVLHVRLPDNSYVSSPPKTILLSVETGEKLFLLHPYDEQYIHLPSVAESVIQQEEYLIGDTPLSSTTLREMGKFYDWERVQAGMGSYLMDNDYELVPTRLLPTTIQESLEEIPPPIMDLPDFKVKAYEFLELLST